MHLSYSEPNFAADIGSNNDFGSLKYKTPLLLTVDKFDDDEPPPISNLGNAVVAIFLQDIEPNLLLRGYELSSRYFGWFDMKNLQNIGQSSKSRKASFLVKQYLFNFVINESAILPDPSPEQLTSCITAMNLPSDYNRTLFLLMGHGLLQNPDQNYFSLTPTSDEDSGNLQYTTLISTFKGPSCFIIDCDYAGTMYQFFSDETIGNKDRFGFFSCMEDEQIPRKVRLPADLFTSCMLTPAYVALLLESKQFYAFKSEGIHELALEDFSENGNLKSNINTIAVIVNKMLLCLVRAMSLQELSPTEHFNIFFRDPKIAHLFANFCYAQRVGDEIGMHPMSYPSIPDFTEHPLWDYLSMYIDHALYYLLTPSEGARFAQVVAQDKTLFLSDVLKSIHNALADKTTKDIPKQFSLMPMIIDDDALVEKGVETLIEYLDCRPISLNYSICLGILESLTAIPVEKHQASIVHTAYCIGNLMAYAYIKKSGYEFYTCHATEIIKGLLMSKDDPLSVTLAIIILSVTCSLDGAYVECAPNIDFFINLACCSNKLHVFWALNFISLFVDAFESLPPGQFNIFYSKVLSAIESDDADIRAAAIAVLASLVPHDTGFESLDLISEIVIENCNSSSQVVRMQTFLLAQNFLLSELASDETAKSKIEGLITGFREDPNPEISSAASNIYANPYHSTALIDGSFNAFLKTQYDQLSDISEPPFNPHLKEPEIKVLPQMGAFPQQNYIFSEIDSLENAAGIVTNIAFLSENHIAFGDSEGTLYLRNYSERIFVAKKPKKQIFTRGLVSFVKPFLSDSLIAGSSTGTVAILSGIHSGEMFVADSFNFPSNNKMTQNCIDYDYLHRCILTCSGSGSVHVWDASRCHEVKPIKVLNEGISKIQIFPEDPMMLGVIGQDSGCLKFFDTRVGYENPAISYGDEFLNFESIPFQRGGFIGLSRSGKVTQSRLNSTNVRSFNNVDPYYSISVSRFKPCFVTVGKTMDVYDLISGNSVPVLNRLYNYGPKAISSIEFSNFRQSFGFVANRNTIKIVNIAN